MNDTYQSIRKEFVKKAIKKIKGSTIKAMMVQDSTIAFEQTKTINKIKKIDGTNTTNKNRIRKQNLNS